MALLSEEGRKDLLSNNVRENITQYVILMEKMRS